MPILAILFIVFYVIGIVLDVRGDSFRSNIIGWILLAILGIAVFYTRF